MGGDVVLTMPHAWQVRFNGSRDRPRGSASTCRSTSASSTSCSARIPDFRRAYEPDGLTPDEFAQFGADRPDPARLRPVVSRSAGRGPRHHDAQPGRQGRLTQGRTFTHEEPGGTQEEHRHMAIETREETAILPILSHWIDGTAVEVLADQTGPVTNPATGKVIARVPRGGQAEVDARRRGREGRVPGVARHAAHRAQQHLLRRSANSCTRTARSWRALITRDHGKTFPDALAEVLRGIETIDFACGLPVHMAGMMTPRTSRPSVDAFTLRQPLGVVAAITPFNFPVMVPMWIYPIALTTGNTRHPQAVLPHAGRHPAPGRAVEGGRPARTACSTSSTAAARRSRRSSSTPTSRRSSSSARRPSGATSTRRAPSAASASGPTPAPRTRWSSCPTRTWTWPPTPPSPRASARPASAAWPRRCIDRRRRHGRAAPAR